MCVWSIDNDGQAKTSLLCCVASAQTHRRTVERRVVPLLDCSTSPESAQWFEHVLNMFWNSWSIRNNARVLGQHWVIFKVWHQISSMCTLIYLQSATLFPHVWSLSWFVWASVVKGPASRTTKFWGCTRHWRLLPLKQKCSIKKLQQDDDCAIVSYLLNGSCK